MSSRRESDERSRDSEFGGSTIAAIQRHLDDQLGHRRARFAWAAVIALVGLAVLMVSMGPRPDLGERPLAWLVTLGMVAMVSAVGLPAIGAGAWFPTTRLSWVLTAVSVVGLGLVAFGHPLTTLSAAAIAPPWSRCAMAVTIGAAVISVAAVMGHAFVQRRAVAAVWWTAGGIAIGSAAFVTGLCSSPVVSHVLAAHIGPAVAALLIGALLGAILHRRAWRRRGAS